MEIKINITKKHLIFLTAIISILAGIFVFAYNTGQPSYVSHTADEIMVTINGEQMSLQDALDQGLVGGGDIVVKTGTLNPGCNWVDIPLPEGFTKEQCKWFASMRYTHTPREHFDFYCVTKETVPQVKCYTCGSHGCCSGEANYLVICKK